MRLAHRCQLPEKTQDAVDKTHQCQRNQGRYQAQHRPHPSLKPPLSSQSHYSDCIFWVKKSFGFTCPSVARKIRRIVSGVGYLLPSSIRQMAAGDKLQRRANLA
tara:strand:- start:852 stop:1163 length:312 start_codon:yes stop_codon:yes gene_type:complete